MPNRISSSMMYLASLGQIQDSNKALYDARNQVATGKRIQSADQDPGSYSSSLALRQAVDDTSQFSIASKAVRNALQSYDASAQSINSIVSQARNIAVQGANGTQDVGSREALADQVDHLLQQTIEIANTYEYGRFIYAGSNDATQPYTVVKGQGGIITGVTYNGDTRDRTVDLEKGNSTEYTVNGTEVFGSDPNAAGSFMGALVQLRDNLRAGNSKYPGNGSFNPDAVSQSIKTFDNLKDTVLSLRSEYGARIAHLDNIQKFRDSYLLTLKANLSSVEDVDLAAASTNLAQQEVTYQGALTVASRLQRDSLRERMR